MERQMGITELRDSLGTVFDEIQFKHNKYIIRRRGKPAGVIVPLYIYENWKRGREWLFELVEKGQEGNEDMSEDEVMALILEAQEAVRTESAREKQV